MGIYNFKVNISLSSNDKFSKQIIYIKDQEYFLITDAF